jgi:hypothetical protein
LRWLSHPLFERIACAPIGTALDDAPLDGVVFEF